jgi:hypothetical protein
MAEKVSGLNALGAIATLLCFFIPATTYTIVRLAQHLRNGYRGLDLVAMLITISTLGAMVYITINAQYLYPRCGASGGDPQIQRCLADRYNDTGEATVVPREQAVALMRSDLLADVTQCVIVPSALGIAVLLVLTRVITSYQKTRTLNKT